MVRAHSFDVFDTLLVRTRARPVDVLRAAAERAVPGTPGDPGRVELVDEVARRRREAEHSACEQLHVDAAGLDAIYGELGSLEALGVSLHVLREAEIAVEEEEIRPVRAGRELVEAARARGERVLFVSDMYLPAAAIRAPLERLGIARPDERLYVSGELGVSKLAGTLFDHILAAEGLAPGELVHTGDDPVTDVEQAARRGIAVEPATTARLDRFEREMLSRSSAPRAVAAQIVGATRAARVLHAPAEGDAAQVAAVGAGVAGPLFASFVAWVLRSARDEGIERLYFVSRDGQVLLRIAEAIAAPGAPECRYLHGSRQAWLLPGVEQVDRRSLAWLLEPRVAPVRDLLARLELRPEDVASQLREHALTLDERPSGDSLERFWRLVEEIEPLVLERAAASRRVALDYFAQEGLDRGRWALVDLGWRLTTQAAVRRILGRDPKDMLGFYFGVSNRKRAPAEEAGGFRAFVLEDQEPGAGYLPESWIWNNTSLIEHVFAGADHGSCTGYERDGDRVAPRLRALAPDPKGEALRTCLHASAVGAARELHAAGLLDDHVLDVRAAGLIAGRALLEQPQREEAAALGAIRASDDQAESRLESLVRPVTLADVAARASKKLGSEVPDTGSVGRWREGSLAVTPARTRFVFHGLRLANLALRRVRRRR